MLTLVADISTLVSLRILSDSNPNPLLRCPNSYDMNMSSSIWFGNHCLEWRERQSGENITIAPTIVATYFPTPTLVIS